MRSIRKFADQAHPGEVEFDATFRRSGPMSGCPFSSRRDFIAAASGIAGALGAGLGSSARATAVADPVVPTAEPFWGAHQAGIMTGRQNHTYFATFDLTTIKRSDVAALMQRWTKAAAAMSSGGSTRDDSSETLGLTPARLTVTFGFGAGLFASQGRDRFALADRRPAALVDWPTSTGHLRPRARRGGLLSGPACAHDPQVAFHAVRELGRLADGVAQMRWVQTGFSAGFASSETPRNLMGFKDGTLNPGPALPGGPDDTHEVVWAGDEGPAWMRGGSYVVVRRIRMALEHWDRTDVDTQEQVFGRRKHGGAPIGGHSEFDALDLAAVDKDGNDVLPEDSHARLAAPAANGGARMLRRAYSYNDGASMTAERWPPWRQGLEMDAGLLFIAYQRDPRTGFIKVFDRMSKLDALNQFTTHTGGGLFACPAGAMRGGYVGQGLLES